MFMKMLISQVKPYLGKIPEAIDSMAQEHNVSECIMMIRNEEVSGKKISTITFMSPNPESGTLEICKKDGKDAIYPIEKLIELMTGEKIDD